MVSVLIFIYFTELTDINLSNHLVFKSFPYTFNITISKFE
jgi:hypothetical protein